MKPIEITIVISPADLAPWNGAEVPIRFVFTETCGVDVSSKAGTLMLSFIERLLAAIEIRWAFE